MELQKNIESRESLSPLVDVLLGNDKDVRFLSGVVFLRSISEAFGSRVIDAVHKWKDISLRPILITSGTSGSGLLWHSTDATEGLTINSAFTAKIKPQYVLELPTGEVVVVKTVNANNTIDVYKRGAGGTTAAAQTTTAFSIKIIGIADVEGSAPSSHNFQGFTDKENYVQTFEDVAIYSRLANLSAHFTGMTAMDATLMVKTKELMRFLNRAIWYGMQERDTTNNINLMGGAKYFGSAQVSNVGGALTVAKFYTALKSHISAGLIPDAFHGSINAVSALEQLYNSSVRTVPSDKIGGQSITTINAMGFEIELLPDRDIADTEGFIVDRSRCAYGPIEGNEPGGAWASYDVYNDGKRVGKQIAGYYTAQFANAGTTRLYGIS